MRASSLCLVFGLVLLMAGTPEATMAQAVPERCCFNFIGFPIPAKNIVSALKTSSRCPAAGIVVMTKRKLEFCVKPDETWLKTVANLQN